MNATGGSGHGASSGQLIGRRMTRVEDGPLLRGQGRFVDDLPMPDALHVAFLRSPVAHGRLNRIDTSAAKARPGVHAVLTFADLRPLLIAAPAAIASAVEDALAPFGVRIRDLPLTPERLLKLIKAQNQACPRCRTGFRRIDPQTPAFAHVPFGKPVPTFPGHALSLRERDGRPSCGGSFSRLPWCCSAARHFTRKATRSAQ